jgi:hypothetical protein
MSIRLFQNVRLIDVPKKTAIWISHNFCSHFEGARSVNGFDMDAGIIKDLTGIVGDKVWSLQHFLYVLPFRDPASSLHKFKKLIS